LEKRGGYFVLLPPKTSGFQMALLLFIDSSTEMANVGLMSNGHCLAWLSYHRPKIHASLLQQMIASICTDMNVRAQDLDGVVVTKGPGSYTGLRVGVSTAKGICAGIDKPLMSMDSLCFWAAQVSTLATAIQAWICPMIDARRMEVYCALYDEKLEIQAETQAKIIEKPPFEAILEQRKIIFVGDGAAKCAAILQAQPQALLFPQPIFSPNILAQYLEQKYQAADFEDLVSFEPFYLKDYVATVPKNMPLHP
jgi:tRNA threonylcarbamoyladenosine biosynthesis protein TsaB